MDGDDDDDGNDYDNGVTGTDTKSLPEETLFFRKSCFHNTVPITKVTVI